MYLPHIGLSPGFNYPLGIDPVHLSTKYMYVGL